MSHSPVLKLRPGVGVDLSPENGQGIVKIDLNGAFPPMTGNINLNGHSIHDGARDVWEHKAPTILHVAPNGNDNNDGKDWGSPLQYISTAIQRVTALGGGTVYIAPGSPANTVAGAGIWLRLNDMGVGGPGWITVNGSLTLIGVPQQSTDSPFGFPKTDIAPKGGTWSGPMLWIAGTLGGLTFKNLNFNNTAYAGYGGPIVRMGLSSPLHAWSSSTTYTTGVGSPADTIAYGGQSYYSLQTGNLNHQPDVSPLWWTRLRPEVNDGLSPAITALVWFENCAFFRGNGAGPAYDAGFSFWIYFDKCEFIKYPPYTGGNSDDDYPMLLCTASVGPAIGNYLYFFYNCRMDGGGILSLGLSAMYLEDALGENMQTPVVQGRAGLSGDVSVVAINVDSADSPWPISLQNDGSLPWRVKDSGVATGPMDRSDLRRLGSLTHHNQYGISGMLSQYQQDGSRRAFGPAAFPYPNIAPQPIGTSVIGPDGSYSGVMPATPYILFGTSGYELPVAGDTYLVGQWVNFGSGFVTNVGNVAVNHGTVDMDVAIMTPGAPTGTQTLTAGAGAVAIWGVDTMLPDSNQWGWVWGIIRIVSAPTGCSMAIGSLCPAGAATAFNVCYRIPAGDLTDEEIGAMALHMHPTPSVGISGDADTPIAPGAGSLPLWPGQAISLWDAGDGAFKYLAIENGVVVVNNSFATGITTRGLVGDFDAAAGVSATGANIDSWTSQASGALVASQTGIHRPTTVGSEALLNGEPAVRLGLNQYLANVTSNAVTPGFPRSVIAAIAIQAGDEGGPLFGFGSGAGNLTSAAFYHYSGISMATWEGTSPVKYNFNNSPGWVYSNIGLLVEIYYDIGGVTRVYVNGVALPIVGGTDLETGSPGFWIGDRALGGVFAYSVGRMLVYDRVLDHDERAAMRAAMNARFFPVAPAPGPISGSLTATNVLYAAGPSTVAQDSRFAYDDGTGILTVPALHANTVNAPTGDLTLSATAGGAQVHIAATTLVQLSGTSYQLSGLTSNGFVTTSGGAGALSIDTTVYETAAHASATYETIAHAAGTYQPIVAETATQVLYSGGGSTISSDGSFAWNNTTGVLTLTNANNFTTAFAGLHIADVGAAGNAVLLVDSAIHCSTFGPKDNNSAQLPITFTAGGGGGTAPLGAELFSIDNGEIQSHDTSGNVNFKVTGGAVELGASGVVANGSVATVLGSLGPAGASTAVRKWLTITVAGVTYYGPLF